MFLKSHWSSGDQSVSIRDRRLSQGGSWVPTMMYFSHAFEIYGAPVPAVVL